MMPPATPVAAGLSQAICRRPRLCCLGGRSFSSDKINSRAQRIPLSRANRARLMRRSRTAARATFFPATAACHSTPTRRAGLRPARNLRASASPTKKPAPFQCRLRWLYHRFRPNSHHHSNTRRAASCTLHADKKTACTIKVQPVSPPPNPPRQTVIPSAARDLLFYNPRIPTYPFATKPSYLSGGRSFSSDIEKPREAPTARAAFSPEPCVHSNHPPAVVDRPGTLAVAFLFLNYRQICPAQLSYH